MKALSVVALILLCTIVRAQDAGKLALYAVEKKETGTALLLGLLLPGAGHIYAENNNAGFTFIISEAACVAWYATQEKRTNTPLYFLGAIRIVDAFTSLLSVGSYNDSLRERIGLYIGARGVGLTIRL